MTFVWDRYIIISSVSNSETNNSTFYCCSVIAALH